MDLAHSKISRTKIFFAAAVLVMIPLIAHADISTSVDGNTVKHFNFNSDTGVAVDGSGKVPTNYGTGSLQIALQSSTDMQAAAEMNSRVEPAAGVSSSASAAPVIRVPASQNMSISEKNLESSVTIYNPAVRN